jgi:hypothetical protein
MFTFGLLAEMGLHATHTVDFQANLRAHLHICTNCITLRPPACPIGLVPAKCFVSSAIGMYGMCLYVYIRPSCRNGSPCHPHSRFSSQFTRTSAHIVHSRTIGVPACPIGLVPVKSFVSSAVAMHGRCIYVYICPSGRNWSPCHPHSRFSSLFARTSAQAVELLPLQFCWALQ